MIDQQWWARLLADATEDGASHPTRLCRLCVQMLGVTGAAIAATTSAGNRKLVCATNDVSARLEDLAVTLGQGPCLDAVRNAAPILAADICEPLEGAGNRWPMFVKGACAVGVCAVFAFPLQVGAISLGALTMYRADPGELSAAELSAALLAADAAALALLDFDTSQGNTVPNDFDARSSYQRQVHQATGMVQVQRGVSTQDAFLILRSRAFGSGRPVVDVASDVVEGRLRFDQDEE